MLLCSPVTTMLHHMETILNKLVFLFGSNAHQDNGHHQLCTTTTESIPKFSWCLTFTITRHTTFLSHLLLHSYYHHLHPFVPLLPHNNKFLLRNMILIQHHIPCLKTIKERNIPQLKLMNIIMNQNTKQV